MNILNKKLQKVLEDPRYSIALENINNTMQYVIRFNNEKIACAASVKDATLEAIIHQGTNLGFM